MATINFLIRSQKKGSLARVILRFRNGRNFDFYVDSGLRIFPDYWNNKSQTLKRGVTLSPDHRGAVKAFRENMTGIKNKISETINGGDMITSKQELQRIIEKYHHPEKRKDKTLNQYIKFYIDGAKNGTRLTDKKRKFAYSTVRVLQGFKNKFDKFQEDTKQYDFKDINIDFYNDFVGYLTEGNLSENTIGRHIRHLKIILRASYNEGYHRNADFMLKAFKDIRIDVDNVYLTGSEVDRIYKLDLSDQPQLDLIRDVFLVGVWTAQRFSDYSRITKDNISTLDDGAKVIIITQKKTGEKVIIPRSPELDQILKKYDYTLPKTYEQLVNKEIKNICKEVDITEPIQIEKIKGGLKITTTKPKNTLVKTHTARRTGATLMYLAGINSIALMKITGHKSEKMLLNYILVSKEETASILSNHAYFRGNPLSVVK